MNRSARKIASVQTARSAENWIGITELERRLDGACGYRLLRKWAAIGEVPSAKQTVHKHWIFRECPVLAKWIQQTKEQRPKRKETDAITEVADLGRRGSHIIRIVSQAVLAFFFDGRKLSHLSPRELLEHERYSSVILTALKSNLSNGNMNQSTTWLTRSAVTITLKHLASMGLLTRKKS